MIEMPPALEAAWHTHGYYGSVSHNVKAIYQRYLGWFDGNPAHLWQHPPEAAATRYVEAFGGVDAVVAKAQGFVDDGDLRFAAELLNHAVFADAANTAARELLAEVLRRRSGYGAENGTWRNFYLHGRPGAARRRRGRRRQPAGAPDMAGALTVDQLFDSLAIRVDGPRAWDEHLAIDWHLHRPRPHLPARAVQRRAHPAPRPGRRPRRPDASRSPSRSCSACWPARAGSTASRPTATSVSSNACSPCSTHRPRLRHRHPVAGLGSGWSLAAPKSALTSTVGRSGALGSAARQPGHGPSATSTWSAPLLRPDRRCPRGASVPEIRYVCLSDLHLGAANSVLTHLDDAGERVAGPAPLLQGVLRGLRQLLEASGTTTPPTLVLHGDLFELALTTTEMAADTFGHFVAEAWGGPEAPLFAPEVLFVPGNHDHHLWEIRGSGSTSTSCTTPYARSAPCATSRRCRPTTSPPPTWSPSSATSPDGRWPSTAPTSAPVPDPLPEPRPGRP